MTNADIIASVGQSRYDEASLILRKQIAGPDPMVPHEVSPAVWESPLPQTEQIALFFELYDDPPSYAMSMYATHVYPDFDERSRESWWRQCLRRLGEGLDVVREPILSSGSSAASGADAPAGRCTRLRRAQESAWRDGTEDRRLKTKDYLSLNTISTFSFARSRPVPRNSRPGIGSSET